MPSQQSLGPYVDPAVPVYANSRYQQIQNREDTCGPVCSLGRTGAVVPEN